MVFFLFFFSFSGIVFKLSPPRDLNWPEREMAPRLSLVSPNVFFSVLSPMEFWFLAAVASGLLSWGHLISSNIVDLIEQKLFELN